MGNIAIFRINYKSDFVLTLNSDAGWLTPFCIKFWTGVPSQAYFVGYDGETYTHCAPVEGEPTKLVVQFDDHHLPVGELKFQIGYHFTVADFPTTVEDEVLNQERVIIERDGHNEKVMLDFNGETAPDIEFSLPAYANEAQRIANEEQRIAAEQQRISNEETRIAAEQTRQQNEQQRISNEEARVREFARLKTASEAATTAATTAAGTADTSARNADEKAAAAQAAATLANDKAQLAADKAALAQAAATLANDKAQLAADKAALAQAAATLANEKAALAQQKAEYAQTQGDYAKAQGDYAKAQGDIALADHERAEADHDTATDDHTTATSDHTQAESDHTRAEEDHTTAASDHTQASSDHGRAESDHTQAAQDHDRAESDHTRAESDHAAVEVYVDSLGAFDLSKHNAVDGVLATYADLSAALTALNALDSKYKYGGMSFKFVLTSDNNYVQYLYIGTSTAAADFTNTDNWEKVIIDEDLKELNQQLVQGWVKGITFAGLYTDGMTTYTATSRFNGLLIYLPVGVKSVKVKSEYGFTNQGVAGYLTSPTAGANKDIVVSRTISDNNIYICSISSNTDGAYILLTIDTLQGQGAFNKENVCVSLDVVKEQRITNLETGQSVLENNVSELSNVNPTLVSIIQGYVKGISFAGLYTDGATTYAATQRFNGLLIFLPPRVTKVKVKSEYGFTNQAVAGYSSLPAAGVTKDVVVTRTKSGDIFTCSVSSNTNGLYILMTIDTQQGTFNKDNVFVSINDAQDAFSPIAEEFQNLKKDAYNGIVRGFNYGGMAYLGGSTLSSASGNFDGFLLFAEHGTERLYISGLTYLDGAVRKNAANAILTFDTFPVVGVTHYLSSRQMSIVGEDVVVTFPSNTNGFYVYVSMNKTLVTLANIGVIIGWRQDKKIEETNARINLLNPFKSKVFVNFGDSIIGNPRGTSPGIDDSISTLLAAAIEATCYNGGFGGCRMATHSSPAWDAFSMHSLADSIASGDWSVQDDAIANYGQTFIDAGVTYFPQTVTMLKGIDWSSVNYITISYGTNDFADNVPLESPNPTHQWDTYKGALEYSLGKILTAYPHIKIIVTTPIWRCWLSGGTIMEDSDEKVNTNGDKLTDFVSAVLNVCGSIHVLGINMYSMLGFNSYTRALYYASNDGAHPNEDGRKRMVGMLAGQLRSNF